MTKETGFIPTVSDDDSGEVVTPTPGAVVIPPAPVERKRQWGLIAATIALGLLLLGAILWVLISQQAAIIQKDQRIEQLSVDNRDLANNLVASQKNADDLYEQIIDLGAKPDGQDPVDVVTPPRNGTNGTDGRDGLDGKDGKDGKDGTPGTPGTPGNNGLDGKDGLNGTDGKDGAPGTNGTNGTNGIDGEDGAPGVGIATITCSDGNLTFTLTNGTVYTFPTDTCKGGPAKP